MRRTLVGVSGAIAWRWWVLGYLWADTKQQFRSALKQFIMRAVDCVSAIGESLIRMLRLGDC